MIFGTPICRNLSKHDRPKKASSLFEEEAFLLIDPHITTYITV